MGPRVRLLQGGLEPGGHSALEAAYDHFRLEVWGKPGLPGDAGALRPHGPAVPVLAGPRAASGVQLRGAELGRAPDLPGRAGRATAARRATSAAAHPARLSPGLDDLPPL